MNCRPESSEGRQGFLYPFAVNATDELSNLYFLVRDFEKIGLNQKEDLLRKLAQETEQAFPGVSIAITVEEQYQNMYEVLKNYPELIDKAIEAAHRAGIEPKLVGARGGKDNTFLSLNGLPCPDIFTGGYNWHSKHEFNSRRGLEKTTETLLNLVQIFAEK